jgi:hypothetical protein
MLNKKLGIKTQMRYFSTVSVKKVFKKRDEIKLTGWLW